MNIKTNQPAERRALFRSLYEQAKNSFSEQLAAFDRHMAQYRGSTELDGSHEAASTVRNITYEIIESQISSTIPDPKVDAISYSERRDRCAKAIEQLCRGLRSRLPFEELNDLDERYTYILGGSVWLLEWDDRLRDHGERGGIRIRCLSPRDFIPQPAIDRIEDMDYCFLRFTATRAELCRTYGISQEAIAQAAVEPDADLSLADGECATVIVCFYRDEEGEIGQFVFSGELTLLDMPAYYRRKRRVCRRCHKEEGLCTCGERADFTEEDELYETVYRKTTLADGVPTSSFVYKNELSVLPEEEQAIIEELRVPYYTPRCFPIVLRKNTSGDGCVLGQSDCEFIRPEQQAINKVESRILQKLLRAGVTPVVPEDATVALNNAVFGQVIKMKPGESVAQYGTVDTTPDISQDIAEAERLYLHAKRTLGISDAYQGIGDNVRAESGYARQLQIDQASGRLRSKRTMKHAAYASIDRLIFSFYLAYADEPRQLAFRDAYGRIHNEAFDRLDFLTYDSMSGSYVFDDGFLFSVDQNGAAEGSRSDLWQRNLENLRSGALGDPTEAVTLLRYWQAQERAHYPYARENVEYFRNCLDGGGAPCPI